jgi:hypothetical protein
MLPRMTPVARALASTPARRPTPARAGEDDDLRAIATVVRALDDALRIPGTRLGIGLDAVLGAIAPGLGDALGGLASLAVLATALRRRVPTVILMRMLVNIAVDVVVGAVPVAGDVFDALWKANRKNLELVERHAGAGTPQTTWRDWAVVGGALALVAASVALPIVLVVWLVGQLG